MNNSHRPRRRVLNREQIANRRRTRRYQSVRRPARRGPRRRLERLRRLKGSQRLLALAMGVAVLVGTSTIAQVSLVGNRSPWGWWWGKGPRPPVCTTSAVPPATPSAQVMTSAPATSPAAPDASAAPISVPATPEATVLPTAGTIVEADGSHHHIGDGQVPLSGRGGGSTCPPTGTPQPSGPVVQPDDPGQSCDNSGLPVHDGFQNGNMCVAVDRGEVPAAENSPSLLIVSSPERIRVNQPFEVVISTRNLVRNFFKPAAQGGYYDSRSFLNEEGILHGHVHTAVRPLGSTRVAPDAAPVPIFFVATEDGRGGRTPDTFVVRVPGLPTAGLYQIASWCGDASHGVPMAQRANQTPCFDATRLTVTR